MTARRLPRLWYLTILFSLIFIFRTSSVISLSTPRSFVQEQAAAFQRCGSPSWYTVIPLVREVGLVDFQFHLRRLFTSQELLAAQSTGRIAAIRKYCEYERLQELALASIRDSLSEYVSQSQQPNEQKPSQLEGSVTVVAGYSEAGLSVKALFSPRQYSRWRDSSPSPFLVDVHPYKRPLPSVKHASWPTERRTIEEQRHRLANETLLLIDDIQESEGNDWCYVTEGLISNAFIIVDSNYDSHYDSRCTDSTKSSTAVNIIASPARFVLSGSMASIVVKLCATMGINYCDQRLPDVRRFREWRGMFVTSSVKGIQPVDGIILPSCIVKASAEGAACSGSSSSSSSSSSWGLSGDSGEWLWSFRDRVLTRLNGDSEEGARISISNSADAYDDAYTIIEMLDDHLHCVLRQGIDYDPSIVSHLPI